MKHLKIKLFIFLLAVTLFIPARADEGLWLFNMPPSAILKTTYNFTVTPEWMQHIHIHFNESA